MYEYGGILKVLHSTDTEQGKKKKKKKSSAIEKEEDGECDDNVLVKLFTKDEEEVSDEEEISDVIETPCIITEKSTEDISCNKEDTVSPVKKKIKIKETPERLERTLFVGNIALTVTKKTLKKMFHKFGAIETVRFRSFVGVDAKVPKKVAIIKRTFHSECQSMNAYIVFKDKDSVGKALSCNGIVLEGLHLRVDKASPEKRPENKNCLFVGNLPFNISEEAIYKHFEQCGEIECIRVVRDQVSGMGKGIGYVTFKSHDGIMFGLKLNASDLNGRAIRVSRAGSKSGSQSGNRFGSGKNNFCGLKSTTSKKDRVKGKGLVQEKKRTSSKNAMQRIKGKTWTKSQSTVKKGKDKKKGFRKK